LGCPKPCYEPMLLLCRVQPALLSALPIEAALHCSQRGQGVSMAVDGLLASGDGLKQR